MSLLARWMYRALVWKERRRAQLARRKQPSEPAPGASRKWAPAGRAAHLEIGERGETLAYWFLRQAGYTIVARNRQTRAGEVDLIGWDGPILAFVEVKTRSSEVAGPPEVAVSRAQQKRIAKAAREHLRRLPRPPAAYRFDIVSLLWEPETGYQVRLIKDAFKG